MGEIWEEVLALLRGKIPPNIFNIWICPMRLIEIKEAKVNLGCPNKFFVNWVKNNYLDVIQSAFDTITQRHCQIDLKVDVVKREYLDSAKRDEQLSFPNIPIYSYTGRRLMKSFTFDQFVVGASNNLAHSAAWALATGNDNYTLPLYFLSNTGLGKSHLTQAIGNHILRHRPNTKIFYLTAEEFTNDMVYSLKKNQIESFKEKYRKNCDILILEETHFLSGKQKIQTELVYTLDALSSDSKKVVFTSSHLPEDIPNLSGRLKSRLASGLITRIDSPDYETRVKILKKKAANYYITVPDEVIQYLAEHIKGDIRQLESSLIGLLARTTLLNEPIDPSMAKETIKGILGKKEIVVSIDTIQALTSSYYKIPIEEMKSKSRRKAIVFCRDVSMYLCRNFTEHSLEAIGRAFNRDHSTVLHGINTIEQEIKRKSKVYYQIDFLSKQLRNIETQP